MCTRLQLIVCGYNFILGLIGIVLIVIGWLSLQHVVYFDDGSQVSITPSVVLMVYGLVITLVSLLSSFKVAVQNRCLLNTLSTVTFFLILIEYAATIRILNFREEIAPTFIIADDLPLITVLIVTLGFLIGFQIPVLLFACFLSSALRNGYQTVALTEPERRKSEDFVRQRQVIYTDL